MKANTKLILAAVVMGVLMIGLTLIMLSVFPQKANLAPGYSSPIIAFEFARSEADVGFLVGEQLSSVENRDGMRLGHRWDMLFPFAYAGFLFFLLLQFYRRGRSPILALAMIISITIVPFDINENLVLLGIVNAAESSALSPELFSKLYIATWAKWGAIAFSVAALAYCYFKTNRWILALSASAFTTIAVLSLALNSPPTMVELMAISLSFFFLFAFVDQCRQLASLSRRIKRT